MYYIKPKILVEKFSLSSIEKFSLGSQILVISSKTVATKYGIKEVLEGLSKNATIHTFDHIRPDAPFEDLDMVLSKLKEVKLDSIVAIGGGSTIDAAKALSIAFGSVSYKDVFYGRSAVPKDKIKLLAIPTTAGTGAELSFGAILYDKENGKKGGVRGEIVQPNYVLIDANLHNGCPKGLKAEVGFDCLTHAVETYISKKSTPIVKMQSVNCIKIIFQHLVPVYNEGKFEDMEQIAIASSLMGINLAFSSTCLPHRIQYVIGPMTGTSHAQGLIALYRGWLKHLKQESVDELKALSSDLGMTVNQFLKKINELKKALDIDFGISRLGINEGHIEEIAQKVTGNMQADPSYKNSSSIIKILKLAL